MIKVGIIGATGYAGNELVRILVNHPEAEIKWLGSKSYDGEKYSDIYRNTFEIIDNICTSKTLEEISEDTDVIFTATPQGYLAGLITDKVLENTKIIDLSADFRLKDVDIYEEWYKINHKRPDLIDEAVYGLCEINRNKITPETRIIANPGCYTTTSILTLYPMVKEGIIDPDSIIIDAKSGTTGAGRKAVTSNLFCEVNESIKAYGVGTHRHTPEIEEQLGYACGKDIKLIFTPHLVPMNRGIIATCYADLIKDISEDEIRNIYNKYYKNEKFIRILDEGVVPETRFIKGSNYVDINFFKEVRTNRLIMIGTLDNIVKGAAGQAVQNMNILFGLKEDTGLNFVPSIV
ncbi:MAG: N-acetyl-gamma-glutamyl-phosphate reductase [Lachnospiraceae bacterium]|nr:N-acetyl-gamma-glutamyl-phosphate reductase [Lachnospiraceae bacterium]